MAEGISQKISAWINALRGKKDQDVRSPEAEAISKGLPSALMPRDAVEKKRKQLRDLDAQTKED